MNVCPSITYLEKLLSGSLPEHEKTNVCQHLDGCAGCRGRLDELTEPEPLRDWRRQCGAKPFAVRETQPLFLLLESLRRTPLSGGSSGTKTFADCHEFLGPPQQKGDLGTLGNYRILTELGRGGMGIVLKAFDPALQRTVALKVLFPQRAHAEARVRFVREARAAAGIESDYVVPVYAVADPENGRPYLVMQYVAGPSLRERIQKKGPLEPKEAARIILQAATGLAAAHQAGFVHRDVKPANILLDLIRERAKIADFGLVRLKENAAGTTQDGSLPGTPEYMSPEQIREPASVDERADVYGLGVSLYEALTGEPPFRGTPHMVLQRVLHDEPLAPRRLNEQLPRDLETVCQKAMAKEPGQRYPTAAELRDDLQRWLNHEPIRARPAGPVERLRRWARRSPRVAGLSAALLLVLAIGFGSVFWQWLRAEGNLRVANQERELARENFRYAQDAVEQYYTRVSENRLLHEPGMQPLRKELLESARDFYERFVRERGNDPALEADLGRALYALACITREIDSSEKSLEQLQQALTIQENLVRTSPDETSRQSELVRTCSSLGSLYTEMGRLDQAAEFHERSLKIWQKLAKQQPLVADFAVGCYRTHTDLGVLYGTKGDPSRAEASFQRALEIGSALAEAHPDVSQYQRNLVRTQICLGEMRWDFQNLTQAAQAYQAALKRSQQLTTRSANEDDQFDLSRAYFYNGTVEFMNSQIAPYTAVADHLAQAQSYFESNFHILQTLKQSNPNILAYRSALARARNNLGLCYEVTGQWAKAENAFREAHELFERLAQEQPQVVSYARRSAMACMNLGNCLLDEGRAESSLEWYDRSIQIMTVLFQKSKDHTPIREILSASYAYRGFARIYLDHCAEAAADFQSAEKYNDGRSRASLVLNRALAEARLNRTDFTSLYRGLYAQAADEAARLTGTCPLTGFLRFGLALFYAAASKTAAEDTAIPASLRSQRAEQYAACAIAHLTRAQMTGYFKFPANRRLLQKAPEFDNLRTRIDFQVFFRQIDR